MKPKTCPHCGNTDPEWFEDNGLAPSHPDYTVLCIAPVAPDAWASSEAPEPDDLNDDGATVPCLMQWGPAEEDETAA